MQQASDRSPRPPLIQIILVGAIGLLVTLGIRITMSLHVLSQHASPLKVGGLIATFSLFPMLLAVLAGRWLDRDGVGRPLRAGTLAMVAGTVLAVWNGHWLALYAAAALTGTGFMLVLTVTQSVIGNMGAPEDRTANFTWHTLGMSIALICGPVVAGFVIEHFSHRASFMLFGGLSLILAALAQLLQFSRPAAAMQADQEQAQEQPQRQRQEHGHGHGQADAQVQQVHRQRGSVMALLWYNQRLRRIYVVNILLAASWDLFMFAAPIHGAQRGFSASTIGLIIGCFSLATFVVRTMMPLLSKRLTPWQIISATLGVTCIGFLLFPWQQQASGMMLLAFMLGLGLGASQPNMLALLFQAAPAEREGEVIGIRMTIGHACQVMLPLTFGAVGASMGLTPVFALMSMALASGLLWIWRTPHYAAAH